MHLGSLSEGDPGDVANAEPQRQSSAQLGLRHGKEAPRGGGVGLVNGPSCWVWMVVCLCVALGS